MIYCGFLVSFAVKHEIYLLLASIWNKLSPYIAKGHTQKKKEKYFENKGWLKLKQTL